MTSLPVTQQRLFEVEDEVRDFIQAMLHELEDIDSDDVDTLADMVLSYLGCADETKESIEEKLREFFPAHSESVADLVWDKLDALAGDAAAAAAAAKPPSVEPETPIEEEDEEGVEAEEDRDAAGGEEESGDGASARGADGASCGGGDEDDDDVGGAGSGDMDDASVTPPVGGDGGGSASFRSISAPHGGSAGTESPQNVPFAHIIQPQQQPRETQASRRGGSREPALPSASATGAADTGAAAAHPSAFQQIAAAAAAAEKQKQQKQQQQQQQQKHQQQRPPARSGDGATPAPVVAAAKVVPQRGYRRSSPHPEGASPVPAVIPAAPVAEQGVVRVQKAGDEDMGWLLADAGAGGKPCVFLKAVAPGAPAARSGMGAYVGRRVAGINGTPVSRTADCWALTHLESLSVKFGEAVPVEEEGGKKLDDDIERLKESLIQKDKQNHGKEKEKTEKKVSKRERSPQQPAAPKDSSAEAPAAKKPRVASDAEEQQKLLQLMLQREKVQMEVREKEKKLAVKEDCRRKGLIDAIRQQHLKQQQQNAVAAAVAGPPKTPSNITPPTNKPTLLEQMARLKPQTAPQSSQPPQAGYPRPDAVQSFLGIAAGIAPAAPQQRNAAPVNPQQQQQLLALLALTQQRNNGGMAQPPLNQHLTQNTHRRGYY